MNLREALRFHRGTRAALVGSGGKTTALFQLARSFEPPVIVTTTTHLGEWQASFADNHWIVTREADVERFAGQIEGVTLLTGAPAGDRRLEGISLDLMEMFRDLAGRFEIPVLIEADGSKQRPLKAPAAHEPVIPVWATDVLVVAGMSGLGRPLSEENVHRPQQFAKLSGLRVGETVTEDAVARVLAHAEGGQKGIPQGARKLCMLNQVERGEVLDAAMRIANSITHTFDSVIITSLKQKKVHALVEPTAGVLLAAGGSSRFGQPKMLLPWHGKPLIRHTAEMALASGLATVLVVVGAAGEQIRQVLAGLPVIFVDNPQWEAGQSTSIRAAMQALPSEVGSAVFLLADQPFVSAALVRALVERKQQSLAPVVAPRVNGRRANPVLFDRIAFQDLGELQGDTGGRALFERYPIEYVDWDDANLLLDIDTPEDYERLRKLT